MDAFEYGDAICEEESLEAEAGWAEENPVARLVLRAGQGDQEARRELVRRFSTRTYRIALGVLKRPHDAEDIVQETFLLGFSQLESCRDPARVGQWLVRIARNRALNLLGSRRVRENARHEAPDEFLEPRAETTGLRERLTLALSRLAPAQRTIVILHDLEGWTHQEIARELGLSEVNCRQHLFQARRALRPLLASDEASVRMRVTARMG